MIPDKTFKLICIAAILAICGGLFACFYFYKVGKTYERITKLRETQARYFEKSMYLQCSDKDSAAFYLAKGMELGKQLDSLELKF